MMTPYIDLPKATSDYTVVPSTTSIAQVISGGSSFQLLISTSESKGGSGTMKSMTSRLISEHPMIALDSDVLGEPRIKGTRMSVSVVLSSLLEYGSFAAVQEEYEDTYSTEELKSAVVFARDLVDECYG